MADQQSRVSEDVNVLHEMGYAQELSRRMGAFQNFAISFAIICIVAGGLTAFPAALSAGGGAAIGVMWVIGSIFALVVAVAMGQVAPSYPTAGGIYHWASIFGGRGFGWAAAWFNLRSSSPSCSSCCMTSGSTGPGSGGQRKAPRRGSRRGQGYHL